MASIQAWEFCNLEVAMAGFEKNHMKKGDDEDDGSWLLVPSWNFESAIDSSIPHRSSCSSNEYDAVPSLVSIFANTATDSEETIDHDHNEGDEDLLQKQRHHVSMLLSDLDSVGSLLSIECEHEDVVQYRSNDTPTKTVYTPYNQYPTQKEDWKTRMIVKEIGVTTSRCRRQDSESMASFLINIWNTIISSSLIGVLKNDHCRQRTVSLSDLTLESGSEYSD